MAGAASWISLAGVAGSRGLMGYDFLGPDAEWKTKWTERVCPHNWLFIFRDTSLGHALYKAKFKWLPAAKQALGQFQESHG
jgi:hypothetical protein